MLPMVAEVVAMSMVMVAKVMAMSLVIVAMATLGITMATTAKVLNMAMEGVFGWV